MCGYCEEGWRFETTELGGPQAGRVKAVLHPISAEWEEGYSRPSTGTIILSTKDPAPEDIWSGKTGLYISQVMRDGTYRPRFGGYIPKYNGAGGGGTTVAFHSIDKFLDKRYLLGPSTPYGLTVQFPTSPTGQLVVSIKKPTSPTVTVGLQTANLGAGKGLASLAAFLVNFARGGLEGEGFVGIPTLTGVADLPDDIFPLAGTWDQPWWNVKNIGQFIAEMVASERGIKYQLEHSRDNGYWSSVMRFADTVGVARDYTLLSDREGWQYALEVDAEEKATRVCGIGSGNEGYTQFSIAYDADSVDNLPEHQSVQSWKDVTNAEVLDGLAKGYVLDHRDPATVPSMTVVGMPDYDPDAAGYEPQKGFPGPEICKPGDTCKVDLGYGVITVRGIAIRILAVAWRLGVGNPVERTLAMQPIIRPNTSVRTQVPAKPPAPTQPIGNTTGGRVSDPWPTAGKVTSATNAALDEISGMEVSVKNPDHVWVHNDEQLANHQVHLVSLEDGHTAATYTPNPGVSAAPIGDPEAIRISKVSGNLVLADIGDNALNRPISGANQPHLLVVDEPEGGGSKGKVTATRLPIAYPYGRRWNAEALLIHPTTDEVFIITKEATRAQVFSYGPLSAMSTTNNVGTLVATLGVRNVTDATHTFAGGFVLLLREGTNSVVVLKLNWLLAGYIPIPAMAKPEAIGVESSCSFVVTTETKSTGSGPAPIYRVLIPTKFGATCSTPAGPTGTGGTPTKTGYKVPGQMIPMTYWKLQLPV